MFKNSMLIALMVFGSILFTAIITALIGPMLFRIFGQGLSKFIPFGGSIGGGASIFGTNASNAAQLFGDFSTFSLNAGVPLAPWLQGTLNVSWGRDASGDLIWLVASGLPYTGVTAGVSASFYTTTTEPLRPNRNCPK